MTETYKFEAEINQLMNLIINAFYSNKDVFLRELISNSSDAIDKIKYESLTEGQDVLEDETNFEIRVIPDKENNTLTIWDTGIGMTKEDLINNLGTVARSGTKAFMQTLQEGGDISLIGQFGVGFYSAYLVADQVDVITKHRTDQVYKWSSDAGGSFTVSPFDDKDLTRGTKIVIHLKDDQLKYLEEDELKNIIQTHSNYINYPIHLLVTKTREKETTNNEEEENKEDNKEDNSEESGVKVEEVDDDNEENEEKKEPETEEYLAFEQVNNNKPVWTKKPEEVTDEEHETFYKSFSNDWQNYLLKTHFKVEGSLEFTTLLYVPERAPFDMFSSPGKRNNLKLYVRRVFITDDCTELIPEYLSFVKGVIDSNDIPLNVSREMLQQNTTMKKMKKHIVKKCIELLTECADDDKEKYEKFWGQYGKNVKLGVYEDQDNQEKLAKLLRFYTMKHKDQWFSLEDYVTEMPESQKDIYYITGDSVENVEDSPFIEAIRNKGYDVIFMIDPIDEHMLQSFKSFDDKKLVDVTKEGLQLDEESEEKKKEKEDLDKEYEPLCNFIKEVLDNKVEKVVVSNRLTRSPCVLSTNKFGWSANMERIVKAQALGNHQLASVMGGKKIMELNSNHGLVKVLKSRYEKDKEDKTVKDLIWLFFETSAMASGFSVDKPTNYAERIYQMIRLGLSSDLEELGELGELGEEENLPEDPSLPELDGEEDDGEMETVD